MIQTQYDCCRCGRTSDLDAMVELCERPSRPHNLVERDPESGRFTVRRADLVEVICQACRVELEEWLRGGRA